MTLERNGEYMMTQNEKKEAIDYIKAQLDGGYIDLGLHDENELEVIRQAIATYDKLPSVKLTDDYDEELFIDDESLCCHKHLYPADVLDALDKQGIINFVRE